MDPEGAPGAREGVEGLPACCSPIQPTTLAAHESLQHPQAFNGDRRSGLRVSHHCRLLRS
jgi:hypothetical protein